MSGKLEFNYGTVCSGKTCYLLNACFNYEKVGWKVCTIKPALDTRSELIETRAHIPPRKADIIISNNESIYDYNSIIDEADVILIDECQFLSPTHIDELRAITVSRDIDILCFGLRTDYNTHLFPAAKRLFELADEIVEIKTICCVCGKSASFNKRVSDTDSNSTIDPSWNKFSQMCYKHYMEK